LFAAAFQHQQLKPLKKRRKTISTLPAKSKLPSDIELGFNFAGGMAKKGPTNIHLTGEF